VHERNFGVNKFWKELKAHYPNNLEFEHSHGLGILRLNNVPEEEEKKLQWFEPNSLEKLFLIEYFAALGSTQLKSFDCVASLKQNLAERDWQIASLEQVVSERDKWIAILKQEVVDRDRRLMIEVQQGAERALPLECELKDAHDQLQSIKKALYGALVFSTRSARLDGCPKAANKTICKVGHTFGKTHLSIAPLELSNKSCASKCSRKVCS